MDVLSDYAKMVCDIYPWIASHTPNLFPPMTLRDPWTAYSLTRPIPGSKGSIFDTYSEYELSKCVHCMFYTYLRFVAAGGISGFAMYNVLTKTQGLRSRRSLRIKFSAVTSFIFANLFYISGGLWCLADRLVDPSGWATAAEHRRRYEKSIIPSDSTKRQKRLIPRLLDEFEEKHGIIPMLNDDLPANQKYWEDTDGINDVGELVLLPPNVRVMVYLATGSRILLPAYHHALDKELPDIKTPEILTSMVTQSEESDELFEMVSELSDTTPSVDDHFVSSEMVSELSDTTPSVDDHFVSSLDTSDEEVELF
eukprot:485842_1